MKERKLTEKERRRKEKFDALCEEMAESGYAKTDLTVGIVAANLLAFVIMAPFMALALILFFYIAGIGSITLSLWEPLAVLPAFISFAAVHELIHGITWGFFAGRSAIEYGIIWSMLTPYCTCSKPLTRGQYILGGLMPTLVLGTALTAAACLSGSLFWLFTAVIMILGGGGDFLIALKYCCTNQKGKPRFITTTHTNAAWLCLKNNFTKGLTFYEREQKAFNRNCRRHRTRYDR